jgi:glycosyltransferase involved in cell wall biosynthesis
LIEPNNVAAIGNKIVELGGDPALRSEIGAAGRKSVGDRFTVERLVGRHIELYERWIKERAEVG